MANNQYNITPITLVATHVNFCLKRLCFFSPYLDFNRVKVEFKLKLKKSANDEEILNLFKDPNYMAQIRYKIAPDKPYNTKIFIVSLSNGNLEKGYPYVSGTKYLYVCKFYDSTEFLSPDLKILNFILDEHFKLFKELRGLSLLEEIGDLSKQWDYLTSNSTSYAPKEVKDYRASRFNSAVHASYLKQDTDDIPF